MIKSNSCPPKLMTPFNDKGIAVAKNGEGYFHIDKYGNELYSFRFHFCRNFHEGFSVVNIGDNYFHINPHGQHLYRDTFDYVSDFNNGFSVVKDKKSKLFSHIKMDGKYLHNQWYQEVDMYFNGYARAKDSKGWFHINEKGESLYSKRFVEVDVLINGYAKVTDKNNHTYIIDKTGNITQTLKKTPLNSFGIVSAEIVSYWKSQTIRAAVDFELFKYLPATIDSLKDQINIEKNILIRLLRALREIDFVVKEGDLYKNTEKSQYLIPDHELSLVPAVYHWTDENYIAWMGLTESLRSGKPSYKNFYNSPIFSWLDTDKAKLKEYHEAMKTYAHHDYSTLIDKLDLSNAQIVIDSAGGQGFILKKLLKKYPHLKGYLLERKAVTETLKVPKNLSERMHVHSFDLFDSWQIKGDFIILSRVLHDWNDSQCEKILKNAYLSLKKGGKIIIIERLLSSDDPDGGLLDLNMLVITGGQERTFLEIEKLMTNTDFCFSKTFCHNKISAIEFIKN